MRLIDADALVEYADETAYDVPCVAVDNIIAAPTIDAVPVVRCRDCKHSKVDWPTGQLCCARNGKVVGDEVWGGIAIRKDGYCNFGERREPDGE